MTHWRETSRTIPGGRQSPGSDGISRYAPPNSILLSSSSPLECGEISNSTRDKAAMSFVLFFIGCVGGLLLLAGYIVSLLV